MNDIHSINEGNILFQGALVAFKRVSKEIEQKQAEMNNRDDGLGLEKVLNEQDNNLVVTLDDHEIDLLA